MALGLTVTGVAAQVPWEDAPARCPLRASWRVDFRDDGRPWPVEWRRCEAPETGVVVDGLWVRDPAGALAWSDDNTSDPGLWSLGRVEPIALAAGGAPELLVLRAFTGTGRHLEWCVLGWRGARLTCRDLPDLDGPSGVALAADEDLCCKGWHFALEAGAVRLERGVYRTGVDPNCCPSRGRLLVRLRPRGDGFVVERVWREP